MISFQRFYGFANYSLLNKSKTFLYNHSINIGMIFRPINKIYHIDIRNQSNGYKYKKNYPSGINISSYIGKAPISQEKLDIFIKQKLSEFKKKDMTNLFQLSGKESKRHNDVLLRDHLPALAFHLKILQVSSSFDISPSWSYKDIAFIIYGLQNFTEKDKGVLDIIQTITKVKIIKQISPSPQNVSMMLIGLQKIGISSEETRRLLAMIALLIDECKETFSAQNVGNVLYGLHNMNSDAYEIRNILTALVPKIENCDETLRAQELANAMYGLQGMNSEVFEVRNILSALSFKILSCNQTLDSQEISNALYGLNNMNSDCIEIRDVLSALTLKVISCNETLKAQSVGNILYGLKGMNSNCIEVRDMLSALVPKVSGCKEILNAQEAGNSLYGLQSMSGEFVEVLDILSALASKIKKCTEALTPQNIGNALYGLQGVLKEAYSLGLLDFLYDQINVVAVNTSKYQLLPFVEIVSMTQDIIMTLPEMKKTLNNDLKYEYEKWYKIQCVLLDELERRRLIDDALFCPGEYKSTSEERVGNLAIKVFENSSIIVSSNEFLFNVFESDTVLRVPIINNSSQVDLIINIEIDGMYHTQAVNKRFCMLRDTYLNTKGVVIARIDSLTLKNMKDEEIKYWLFKTVVDVKNLYVSEKNVI